MGGWKQVFRPGHPLGIKPTPDYPAPQVSQSAYCVHAPSLRTILFVSQAPYRCTINAYTWLCFTGSLAYKATYMQGQETRQLETWLFALQLSGPDLPSSYPVCPPHKLGGIGIRHSTTMLADEHTTAKSRRPLCINAKASSYHEKTSCKTLELEKLSFRSSQVNDPLTTGVATPHGAAMPAVKKAGTPGLPCRHRLALFASHLATRRATGARLVTLCLFPYKSKALSVEDAQ